jgi:hypothetical protein
VILFLKDFQNFPTTNFSKSNLVAIPLELNHLSSMVAGFEVLLKMMVATKFGLAYFTNVPEKRES